ncbi:MAG TPA: type II secretion system protein GspC [Steroidobacteraceae bacterium]|nr:type II secretion system protein GspC [Steroidobacteraceae bacterium]
MQVTHSNEWLARLQSNGPTYVSLVLAALVAVELARIAMTLLSPAVKSPQPTIARGVAPSNRSMADVQAVVSAHLFGMAVADASTQDPSQAPLSSANLILAGTIATDDPKRGIAIISDGGPSKVYAVGENVSGATLHSVYLDHVILDRGGTLETLLLPRQVLETGAPRAAMRRGANPNTAAAVETIRHMVEKDPGLLDQVMRTVPSYDNQAGKLRGFRAYPGRNRAIFAKLGLKPGDLVTAINGQPLDDPQHSQDVFNTIQSSDSVTVTIERGGQREDISLNIAQVAGEASRDLEGAGGSGAAPGAPGTPAAGMRGAFAPPVAPPPTAPGNTNQTANE